MKNKYVFCSTFLIESAKKYFFFYGLFLICNVGFCQKTKNVTLENYLLKLEEYRYSSRFDSAKYYFKKALPIAIKQKDSLLIFRAYKKMGDAYEHARIFDSTLYVYEKCRAYIPKNNLKLLSFFLADKAYTYRLIGNHNTSTKLYKEAYAIAEKTKDLKLIAGSLHNLADDYDYLGMYQKANDCYEKSITLALTSKNKELIAVGYRYYSSTLIKQKRFDYAFSNLLKAEKIYTKANDSISLAYTWAVFSDYYWAIGQQQKSFAIAVKAQKEWESRNEISDLIKLYLTQGKHYLEINNLEQAAYYLFKLEKINVTENITKKELFENLALLNERKGNYRVANLYWKKTNNFQNIIQKEQSNNQLAAIRLKYDSDKKELEISKVKAESIAKSKQQTYILIITFLLMVLLCFLYYAYRKNEIKNRMITKALAKSEMLLQEIHHRVKNNLAMLNSLLYLQAKATTTEEARLILNECQLRIQSMALVHQNLLDINNNENVDFDRFLLQLFAKTSSAFNTKNNEVKFSIDSHKPEIELAIAVDLGIIINELTTNSLKYAFENQQNPHIKVTIARKNNRLTIEYSDNGIGMENSFLESKTGFGFKLINILIKQLDGNIEYEYKNQISTFKIEINAK